MIDYDLDGWPDLAAAMLNGIPRLANSDPNRIFRNHSGQFTETTPSTGYEDRGFGQGITGDFNDDGFPDLFNANIGENRLYQNNGDGTFTEISKQAGLSGASWTTSATLADLDGDGISDLLKRPIAVVTTLPSALQESARTLLHLHATQVSSGTGSCLERAKRWHIFRSHGSWLNQETPGRGMGFAGRLLG